MMRNVKLPGGTPNVGVDQGYLPCNALYTVRDVVIAMKTHRVGIITIGYKPDKDELRRLNEGGTILLEFIGEPGSTPPHQLFVGET